MMTTVQTEADFPQSENHQQQVFCAASLALCDVAGSIALFLASELIVDLVSSDSALGATSVMTNPAEAVASFDGPFFLFFLFLFLDLLGFVDKMCFLCFLLLKIQMPIKKNR